MRLLPALPLVLWALPRLLHLWVPGYRRRKVFNRCGGVEIDATKSAKFPPRKVGGEIEYGSFFRCQWYYPACNTEIVIVLNARRNAHSLQRLQNPDTRGIPGVPADQKVRNSGEFYIMDRYDQHTDGPHTGTDKHLQ